MSKNGERAVGSPVFVPQQHPELTQLGRKPIHNFLKERERYTRHVKDAQAQGSTFQPVTVVASVDYDLFTSLIELDVFENVASIDDLTDQILLPWLKEQAGVSQDNYSIEELDALVKKSVHIKVHEVDPKLRIMGLFTDYRTFLRQRNIEHILKNNPRVAVGHICSLLRPPTLRKKIENDLELHQPALKQDWKQFYLCVLQKAVACDEFVDARERAEAPGTTPGRKNGTAVRGSPMSQKERGKAHAKDEENHDTKKKTLQFQAAAPAKRPGLPKEQQNKAVKEIPFCLNLETCNGICHYMQDRDKTSEKKKKEASQGV